MTPTARVIVTHRGGADFNVEVETPEGERCLLPVCEVSWTAKANEPPRLIVEMFRGKIDFDFDL